MFKWRTGIVAALLVCLGCSGSNSPQAVSRADDLPVPDDALVVQSQGLPGGTLNYVLRRDPASFNLVGSQDTRTQLVSSLFTATLLELDRTDQTPKPALIRDWRWSDDGLTLDLELRRGLRFADGEPIDIEDLLFSISKVLDPSSSTSLRASLLFEGQEIEAAAVDDWTVRLSLARPDASLEYFLCNWALLPKHRFGDASQPLETYWTLQTPLEELTGAGPFRITEFEPGRHIVLARNPHYWKVDAQGQRLPYLDGVRIEFISEIDQQVLRLRNGELDLIDQSLSPELFGQLQQDPSVTAINAGPSGDVVLFWFNQNLQLEPPADSPFLSSAKKRWFGDRRFREAFDLAFSRSQVAQVAFGGQAKPAASLVTNESWLAPSAKVPEQNLAAAQELLGQAGFRRQGQDGPLVDAQGVPVELELLVLDQPTAIATAAMLQQDLQALGIQIRISRQDLRAVASRVMGSRIYDVALAIFSIPLQPSQMSNVLFTSSQMHLWHPLQTMPATEWEGRIDHLMSAQRVTRDLDKRREMVYEAQRVLGRQKVLLPVVERDLLIGHDPRLRNIKPAKPSPAVLWNTWEIFFAQP
ncbi:MAG TPA: ABC transporter substrate-binding protein [Acidobacteriota bacterium]|nr:ABC transporter substrate-binding protein [Acidobacteriota bacterium]